MRDTRHLAGALTIGAVALLALLAGCARDRCPELQTKLSRCGIVAYTCSAQMLEQADLILDSDCATLHSSGKDDGSLWSCAEGEASWLLGCHAIEYPVECASVGIAAAVLRAPGCPAPVRQRLIRSTCTALAALSRGIGAIARVGAGTGTAEDHQGLSLWFSDGREANASRLDLDRIHAVLERTFDGLASDEGVTYDCRPSSTCARDPLAVLAARRVESRSTGVVYWRKVYVCNADAGLPMDHGVLHEATHLFARTADHGYGGPCRYWEPGEGFGYSAFYLTRDQLAENADTLTQWLLHGSTPERPSAGVRMMLTATGLALDSVEPGSLLDVMIKDIDVPVVDGTCQLPER